MLFPNAALLIVNNWSRVVHMAIGAHSAQHAQHAHVSHSRSRKPYSISSQVVTDGMHSMQLHQSYVYFYVQRHFVTAQHSAITATAMFWVRHW